MGLRKRSGPPIHAGICTTCTQAFPIHTNEEAKSTIPPHRNQIWSQNTICQTGLHGSPPQPHREEIHPKSMQQVPILQTSCRQHSPNTHKAPSRCNQPTQPKKHCHIPTNCSIISPHKKMRYSHTTAVKWSWRSIATPATCASQKPKAKTFLHVY